MGQRKKGVSILTRSASEGVETLNLRAPRLRFGLVCGVLKHPLVYVMAGEETNIKSFNTLERICSKTAAVSLRRIPAIPLQFWRDSDCPLHDDMAPASGHVAREVLPHEHRELYQEDIASGIIVSSVVPVPAVPGGRAWPE